MSDGPPHSTARLSCRVATLGGIRSINGREPEMRSKAFISDYYYQNSTQHEPGWIPWIDVLFVVTEIVVGLMG
ncbi:MAG TPA: hypothetical protein VJ372_17515 [Pyrinomonadaceae bacterium]|jgi:hypothetical protein|nr:hypothetical protein [Pyrinomonadaceae bacterium]